MTYGGNTHTSGDVPVDRKVYIEGDIVTVLGNTGELEGEGYIRSLDGIPTFRVPPPLSSRRQFYNG